MIYVKIITSFAITSIVAEFDIIINNGQEIQLIGSFNVDTKNIINPT